MMKLLEVIGRSGVGPVLGFLITLAAFRFALGG
jgi:hypothetical protein